MKTLYIDFDSTIVDSIKQICKMLNKKLNVNRNVNNLKRWDFYDLYPEITKKDIIYLFDQKDFFNEVEFIDMSYELLFKLSKHYIIKIATAGTQTNFDNKLEFVQSHMQFVNSVLRFESQNKSGYDMSDGIHIDDNVNALRSSNAKVKILFKNNKNYSWQQIEPCEEIYIANNWKEIFDICMFLKENEFDTHKECIGI